jgi:hypothetical protein
VILERELGKDAVDDGRGRLAGRVAGELALGRERDSGDPCAAVTGRLANEQNRRVAACLQVAREPLGEALVPVLVERRADSRRSRAAMPIRLMPAWSDQRHETVTALCRGAHDARSRAERTLRTGHVRQTKVGKM